MANKQTLLEFLKQPLLPPLKEQEYKGKLVKWEVITPKKLDINGLETTGTPYVQLTLSIIDGDKPRKLTDNRYEKGFPIAISHIRKQLNIDDEIIPTDFLNSLVEDATPISVWITRTTAKGREYTNINYLPPIEEQAKETTDVADLAEKLTT